MSVHRKIDQGDLFASAPALPPGLLYREAAISAAQERDLTARFADLPFAPFEFHGYRGNRRIVSFGWHYDYAGRTVRKSAALPDFLLPLRDAATSLAGLPADNLQQVLVTQYPPGAGIGWHRDKPEFEDIVAFSFLAPCVLRFRRAHEETWQRAKLVVEPRSAYLLRGPARRDWYHSIPPVDVLRYSVTFRNFVPGYSSPK